MKGVLLIRSNVRKNTEFSVSDEFLDEFEKEINDMLKKAEKRADANKRRTLLSRDL
jgi:histone H3/H4